MKLPNLPISEVLDDIDTELRTGKNLVIAAPPGAGKTTLVPLKLLDAPWRNDGRIILIEPRRLAARAAARRMASILGEDVGERVGYRMRLDNRIGKNTRIEVVTEGVFSRMILDDPELKGIACVIFDEFHERALDADFGLALALDVQAALREDLRIIIMSATLDIEEICKLVPDAKSIESKGRSFPIDIIYWPRRARTRIEDVMADAAMKMHREHSGSILCFLPGMAEIKRTYERLSGKLGDDTDLYALHGSLSSVEQDKAIRPAEKNRRKVVLASAIAETSITIDGVRIIIDSGLQRQAFFEAATGITRLETSRVSQSSATQRAGRAGRTEPGIALRLWQEEQQAALPKFSAPQILTSDLSPLLLDSLSWGVQDLTDLSFITAPPESALKAARELLLVLGAIDDANTITKMGKAMRQLPLPPRLAAMVIGAKNKRSREKAAKLAILLTEQGLGGQTADLELRLKNFENDRSRRSKAAMNLALRIAGSVDKISESDDNSEMTCGEILEIGFSDRIAKRREQTGHYTMANGRGAAIDELDGLARHDMLVVADLTGKAVAPRILSACAFDLATLEGATNSAVEVIEEYKFDKQSSSVRGRLVQKLGAIKLSEKPLPKPKGEKAIEALIEGIQKIGIDILPFSKSINDFRARSEFYRMRADDDWPDMSDAGLLLSMDKWFAPFQSNISSVSDVSSQSIDNGIKNLLSWDQQQSLDRNVPTHFTFPDGKRISISYEGDDALLSVRVQQLYGQTQHPSILSHKLPLLLELLSPAGRPIQLTRDLPGFWKGSWADVRSDMRGRYPKHDWPEDPATAKPPQRRR